jgi:DNA primase
MSRDEWNALVEQARASDMLRLAAAHGAELRKCGGEYVGACPVCGTGHDRFAIRPAKQLFICRVCGIGGCGPIDLEMFLGDCDFVEAVKQLTNTTSLSGKRPATKTAANLQAEDQRRRERAGEETSQHAKAAWLWQQRQPAAGSAVERYLRARGYVGATPPTIGYLPARGEHPHAMISAFALPN